MEGVGSTGGRVGRWELGGVGQDRGALAVRVGVGAGGPQVKTRKPMVQGDTWLLGPFSRPALRAPLLVDRLHLVPPDHGRLPP